MVKKVGVKDSLVYSCICGFQTNGVTKADLKELRLHFSTVGKTEKGKHKSKGLINSKTGVVVVPPLSERTPQQTSKIKHGKMKEVIEQRLSELGQTTPTSGQEESDKENPESAEVGENKETKSTKVGAKVKPPVSPKQIEVGKISIVPENWVLTQHGALLILDTYKKAQQDIGYSGTIGDFLVDVCTLHRRIMNYGEVEYARRDGEGGNGHSENGEESLRELIGDQSE